MLYRKITKKSRIEGCRRLIDEQPIGKLFSPDVLAEFEALTGVELLAAKRMVNHEYPKDTRHVHALRLDGVWEPFSWNKAISPPNPRTELKGWLRDEIQQDLDDYRSAAWPLECRDCGDTENLTTDHYGKSFDAIAEAWLNENGEPEMIPGRGNQGAMIRDRDIAAAWITYHASHAVYQLLCLSCNASKGKG